MDPQSSVVTVIGLYAPERAGVRVFIDGINLDSFPDEASRFDLLVTFNGNTFDLPFLRRAFPDARLPPGSIDLRWLCRELRLTGGLKKIERQVGILRHDSVGDFTGAEAVTLWQRYIRGDDEEALRLLVRYNLEDTVNLERLLIHCLNSIYRQHPFLGIEQLADRLVATYQLDVDGLIADARAQDS